MSNVLVDCYVFEGEFQGTRTFIKEVYQKIFEIESNLGKNQINKYFLITNNPEELSIDFSKYEFVYLLKSTFRSRIIRLLLEYPYIILKYKIDYAHFQYVVPPIKFCKYILTIHDILFCEFKNYFSFKYRIKNFITFFLSYLLSDYITTVSNHSKDSILHYFKYTKKIELTPNGVNYKFHNYTPKVNKDEFLTIQNIRNYFLYVSRFEPRKNHLNLLIAFVEGNFYLKYDLILIGFLTLDCPEFYKYYHQLNDSIKSTIYIIHKGVNENLLLDYYHFCTIFIYPSLLEGFGIPPLEASAMGKPVICSNLTAMQDFNFYKEFHINPSIDNINASIKLILNKSINTLNIKNIIIEKYNWEISAKKFHNIFSNIYK